MCARRFLPRACRCDPHLHIQGRALDEAACTTSVFLRCGRECGRRVYNAENGATRTALIRVYAAYRRLAVVAGYVSQQRTSMSVLALGEGQRKKEGSKKHMADKNIELPARVEGFKHKRGFVKSACLIMSESRLVLAEHRISTRFRHLRVPLDPRVTRRRSRIKCASR